MPLPTKFDENEIFLLMLSVILLLILVKIVPIRFTYTTSIILYLYNISVGISVDQLLAGPPLDFYDVLDSEKFELFDLIMYIFVYGPSTYIVIYMYDKWFYHRPNLWKFVFLLFISIANVGLELIAEQLHVYEYKGWKIYYSFGVYFVFYLTNFFLLRLLKKNETFLFTTSTNE